MSTSHEFVCRLFTRPSYINIDCTWYDVESNTLT